MNNEFENSLFLPYNLSLELKELGWFDKLCFGWYQEKRLKIEITKLTSESQMYMRDEDCLSPTYEQAIDWLLKIINEGKSFGNERGYRYDGTYFSLTWGGMTMKVTTSKEEVVIELIKILKGEDE